MPPPPHSTAAPSMRCSVCSHTFCFTHGDSHTGKSCSQWARDNLESESETLKAIKSFTKPCPGCSVSTQKSAGCNHMKCTQCKTEWQVARPRSGASPSRRTARNLQLTPSPSTCRCWLCASAIVPGGTYPSHYSRWNVFGCRGGQFTDERPETSKCATALSVLFSPVILALGLALFALWCYARSMACLLHVTCYFLASGCHFSLFGLGCTCAALARETLGFRGSS